MPLSVGRTAESTNGIAFAKQKDNSVLTSDDFMKLFVKQLQNQDFTSPMDSGEMMEQITQLSNMQMMQSMAEHSKSSFAVSLIGKYVTAVTTDAIGAAKTVSGVIDRIVPEGEDYVFYVGGKRFSIGDIIEIGIPVAEPEASE